MTWDPDMILNDPTPHALVLYSNPPSTSRLSLDREHRSIDKALAELGLPATLVQRLHAVSVEDFAAALQARSFEILHFSGHGSPEGIFLENGKSNEAELIDVSRLTKILKATAATPRLLLFLSCFSSSSIHELAMLAPFVVTVTGKLSDDCAIEFARTFYREYFDTRSIEHSFKLASSMVEYFNPGAQFYPVLTRRAEFDKNHIFCAATFPGKGRDSLLIDLSRVESQIDQLKVSRDQFLALVSRKIRIHQFIFEHPSERTILSLGPYFAEFSWQSADDPIVCHRILQIVEDADEELCAIWADLIVSYNDLTVAPYRKVETPAAPQNERTLQRSLEDMHALANHFFLKRDRGDRLRKAVPKEFKIAKSLVLAHLRQADSALHRGELTRVVVYLESALTTVHDLLDALASALTLPV